MRNEEEMYSLILDTVENDERIRAVYLNGSRANPNIKKDIFQDYDIVYVVKETESFIDDEKWTSNFGQPIIFQEPDKLDKMQGIEVDFSKGYTFLMQFTDENRIDLHLQTVEMMLQEYGKDKLTIPLLDKDNILPKIPKPSDQDYWVKKPSYGEYYAKCNNFWWVAPYCAKGLWREEILYSIETMNNYIRQNLMLMISWYVGINTDFKISLGKADKFLKEYVDDDIWNKLMSTFDMSNYESSWSALITAAELYNKIAPIVGEKLGYEYNYAEAARSFKFINDIRKLPRDAKEIY